MPAKKIMREIACLLACTANVTVRCDLKHSLLCPYDVKERVWVWFYLISVIDCTPMCPCGQALIPKRQRIHANIHNLRRKVALYLRNSGLGLNFFIQREPRPHGSGTSVSSFRFSCPKSMQRAFSLLKARLFPARSFLSSPLFSLSKKPSFFAIYGNVTPYAQAGDCFWVFWSRGSEYYAMG